MAVAEIPYPGAAAAIPLTYPYRVDADSGLQVVTVNSAVGVTLTIQGRRIDQNGEIVPFVFTVTPASNRTTQRAVFPIGPGALVTATVFVSSGAIPLYGQCYVMLNLVAGLGAALTIVGTLIGGYVTGTQALGFPGTPIRSSLDGAPPVFEIGVTLPPAGIDWSQTVPTGARWEILSASGTLNTGAVVTNRTPRLYLQRTGDPIWLSPQNVQQVASTGQYYTWIPNGQLALPANSLVATAPLPTPNTLLSGWVIQTSTVNLAAGDNWSTPLLTVREWLEVF